MMLLGNFTVTCQNFLHIREDLGFPSLRMFRESSWTSANAEHLCFVFTERCLTWTAKREGGH